MNQVVTYSLCGAGGMLLFLGAFVGFARLQGAPMHALPVVGSFFPSPEPGEEHADGQGPADAHASPGGSEHASAAETAAAAAQSRETHSSDPREPVGKGHAGEADVLDLFRIDSPFSAEELRDLVTQLKRKNREVDRRLAEIALQEQLLADRAETLDERQAALVELRGQLETTGRELEARKAELDRDEQAEAERAAEGWARLAKLFEKGDVSELGARLKTYSPEDAAQILGRLKPPRAQEILGTLTGEDWKRYAEAFRKAPK